MIDDYLKILVQCPQHDRAQIDKVIVDRITTLIGLPVVEQETKMHEILDDAAYGALASDFGMLAMDAAWQMMKKELSK